MAQYKISQRISKSKTFLRANVWGDLQLRVKISISYRMVQSEFRMTWLSDLATEAPVVACLSRNYHHLSITMLEIMGSFLIVVHVNPCY